MEYSESRHAYEKVGEATETALVCLVEKMNVTKVSKSNLTNHQLAMICNRDIQVVDLLSYVLLNFCDLFRYFSFYCRKCMKENLLLSFLGIGSQCLRMSSLEVKFLALKKSSLLR